MEQRIFLCGIQQETASFNPNLTPLEEFIGKGYAQGEAVVNNHRGAKSCGGGMVAAAEENGYTVVGGVDIGCHSGGAAKDEVAQWFLSQTLPMLRAAMPVKAVFVTLHGATQSDASDDVCGDVLTAIREVVGEEVVIAASCDLHGNVTERMMRAADFISGYQTYPHLDFFSTGYRVASLAIRKLQGKPTRMAWTTVPQTAPAHGYTTTAGGLKKLMDRAHALVKDGTILDFSIFQVQPWLDVCKSGSTVLVAAEDEATAKAVADDLAAEEFSLREELQGPRLWTIEEVVQAAIDNTEDKPVVLVDSADSLGAGSSADSAEVLRWLLPHRDTLRSAITVTDLPAVDKAFALGVGGKADFTLGATVAPSLSSPVEVKDCVVRSLHNGDFILEGPASRGSQTSLGRTAVLQAGQIFIVVCSYCSNSRDLQAYRGVGVEPTLCRLVNVKACTSFHAAYDPIAAQTCNTITPGAAGVQLTILPFKRIPAPFYPFRETTQDMVPAAVCLR